MHKHALSAPSCAGTVEYLLLIPDCSRGTPNPRKVRLQDAARQPMLDTIGMERSVKLAAPKLTAVSSCCHPFQQA